MYARVVVGLSPFSASFVPVLLCCWIALTNEDLLDDFLELTKHWRRCRIEGAAMRFSLSTGSATSVQQLYRKTPELYRKCSTTLKWCQYHQSRYLSRSSIFRRTECYFQKIEFLKLRSKNIVDICYYKNSITRICFWDSQLKYCRIYASFHFILHPDSIFAYIYNISSCPNIHYWNNVQVN